MAMRLLGGKEGKGKDSKDNGKTMKVAGNKECKGGKAMAKATRVVDKQ